MRTIVKMKFGSHLYGTETESSDIDLKRVFIPPARDILLQRVKNTTKAGPEKLNTEKNKPGDIEEEGFSLQRFLALAADGQTVALDMLFAPDEMILEETAEWREIIANRPRLLTKKSAAFLGYCKQQANKYGIKGSRVAAARKAYEFLARKASDMGPRWPLGELADDIEAMCVDTEHMQIEGKEQPGGTTVKYWNVCGRMLQYTGTIVHARDVMKILVDEYGKRALQAESQQGVDWKALSHAVRVGYQAIELLETGHVTLPLVKAKHVLAIKQGKFLYQDVADEIEQLLVGVEVAAAASKLPDEPDLKWIDDFVAWAHLTQMHREHVEAFQVST